jgi:hypothetical protein
MEPRHITGLDFFCAANAQNDLVHEPVVDTVPDQSNHEGDQRAVCATEGPTNPDCDHGQKRHEKSHFQGVHLNLLGRLKPGIL